MNRNLGSNWYYDIINVGFDRIQWNVIDLMIIRMMKISDIIVIQIMIISNRIDINVKSLHINNEDWILIEILDVIDITIPICSIW